MLQQLEEIPTVNFVVLAGDLYDYPDCHKLGGTGDVTSVWNAFAQSFDSVVGVHGNHDAITEVDMAANTIVLDGNTTNINSIAIGGVCGIIGRVERNQRKTEEQFKKSLENITSDKTDLVVLHQGPDDPINNQKGESFIREHLENNGSSIIIFGHYHWNKPLIEIGNNQVLNVDNQVYIFTE
ncbi:metallophosphoesterase family protein [Spartinivicinus marinus]|uniref:metallophosphoesterase family protein n=1 Tax=Spartinivicinus marinus TaxID=2994442 RepID=UPI001C5C91DD|nr:metallophosphoesterase [Spartinivicinus marinus]